ncbi:MAG: Rab family GTPase [Candidatus Hodarchaeales archaeon]|jgi:small GTP-binding protein
MVFDRDLRVTILGNAGVGKTTLIKRLKGDDMDESEKTTVINVEKKKIKLLSQKEARRLSKDRYRYYNITAVDTPGDFTLRRQWRVAMAKFKADGIIFMLDPTQDYVVQRTAMEDAFNYYLDSLDMNAQKADKIAETKNALFYFIVNKIDLIDNDTKRARKFIDKFSDTLKVYYERFPKAHFRESYISVHKSDYKEIDKIFEVIKLALYETSEK